MKFRKLLALSAAATALLAASCGGDDDSSGADTAATESTAAAATGRRSGHHGACRRRRHHGRHVVARGRRRDNDHRRRKRRGGLHGDRSRHQRRLRRVLAVGEPRPAAQLGRVDRRNRTGRHVRRTDALEPRDEHLGTARGRVTRGQRRLLDVDAQDPTGHHLLERRPVRRPACRRQPEAAAGPGPPGGTRPRRAGRLRGDHRA